MNTGVIVLYAFCFVAASIFLQQALPFPYGLYSGLVVFAAVPFIIRQYVKDFQKKQGAPAKS